MDWPRVGAGLFLEAMLILTLRFMLLSVRYQRSLSLVQEMDWRWFGTESFLEAMARSFDSQSMCLVICGLKHSSLWMSYNVCSVINPWGAETQVLGFIGQYCTCICI